MTAVPITKYTMRSEIRLTEEGLYCLVNNHLSRWQDTELVWQINIADVEILDFEVNNLDADL